MYVVYDKAPSNDTASRIEYNIHIHLNKLMRDPDVDNNFKATKKQ